MEIKPLDLTLQQWVKDHIEFREFLEKKMREYCMSELKIDKSRFGEK